jgi:hypothetical protein
VQRDRRSVGLDCVCHTFSLEVEVSELFPAISLCIKDFSRSKEIDCGVQFDFGVSKVLDS